ncbi:MAG: Pls/PosA family non-ribosomal peptide synthetase, partial [Mycobacterium leprae]
LLATLDEDLPGLRFLLVSGEACPQDLITRWHKPGRRFLNVYGPTEATVTATWTPVHPDRPVTIGVPLPTYSVVILDPISPRALARGEMGEIGIAGIGLATGYLNRADLTERVFIRDFLGIPGNPSGRIYRTGDLGRINDDGEIEYHGRIDTQVKIRGYRIELTEIESVLLQVPGIAQAVVDTHSPEPGVVDLVGYYSLRPDTGSLDPQHVYQHLRARLPGYMVPAYLEPLAAIPTMPSGKADRKNLHTPRGPRSLASHRTYVAPTTDTEQVLADALAHVLRLDRVSVDSHFFDDLGANSLLIAQFCARVRQHGGLPSVATKDVYLHPTIRSLAAALETSVAASASVEPARLRTTRPPTRARTPQYVLCGALQLLVFLTYTCLTALIMVKGFRWISAATGVVDVYQRSVVFGAATFVGLSAIPILAKWLLVGRWKPREIPIWSLGYLRFWVVKTLTRFSPLSLFVGSPLYVLYLRALGAKIGRGVLILSRNTPVCTDLLTIGDGSVLRQDSFFTGYRAYAGRIETGPVTLGADVYVGEKSVLDVGASMGDGAQLGHASSLHAGQTVPAGERWHGSPAQRTDTNYRRVEDTRCGTLRRASYGIAQLVEALVLVAPLGLGILGALLPKLLASDILSVTTWQFYLNVMAATFVVFFGTVLTGLVAVLTVPRLLNLTLTPGKIYPLYGFHYAVTRAVSRMTNAKFYMDLFGDSSYIVNYLRALGYKLSGVVQTGSNFGTTLKQDSPYLTSVGTGTMVSDALAVVNSDYSSTSFRVSQVSIGAHNYLGNDIVFTSGARAGDNCLLATKVLIPIDGPVRENVGLLGSPCFEIPRSVQRDSTFDHLKSGEEYRRRLAGKNRYNIVTMLVFLLVRWIQFFGITLITAVAAHHYGRYGVTAVAAGLVLVLLFSVAYSVLVERAAAGFRALQPRFCSVYDPYFWWHERLWKLLATPRFYGTPFQALILRLLGVRIGRRVYKDGCDIAEKTLAAIGDDVTLNVGSTIQCHSLEEGVFKSDYTTIGAGCTLGIDAFVHFGVTIGDGAVIEPDSFVMKGEEIAPYARWGGNPARELHVGSSVDTSPGTLPVPAQRTGWGRRRERRSGPSRPGRTATTSARTGMRATGSGTAMDEGSPPAGSARVAGPDGTPSKARITGVDATRGIALIGMIAVHVFDSFRADGTPTTVMSVAGGRAAATFAFVAGISLAFLSGGRRPVEGRARAAAAASIAVRAALIAGIGLALGY